MRAIDKEAVRWFDQAMDDYRSRYPNGLPGGSPYQVYSTTELHTALVDLKVVVQAAEKFLKTKYTK